MGRISLSIALQATIKHVFGCILAFLYIILNIVGLINNEEYLHLGYNNRQLETQEVSRKADKKKLSIPILLNPETLIQSTKL